MSHRLHVALAVCAALATLGGAAHGAAPTIRDLKRNVEVRPDSAVQGGASRAMENYRRFLELQKTDPALRAEALRRLGDLSLESGELERMESEVTRVDLAGGEAIELYTTLLKAHPDYPRNDQVLYQLARAYETTGQPELALATLDESVRRYPSSRDMAEVQFRRGEILFSAMRYADAQKAYATVLQIGRADPARGGVFYQQSLYKHGWSLFKQSLDEDSLPSFADLLDLKLVDRAASGAARPIDALSRADREMVEDTLRVMSITFSNTEGSESLDAFIARRGQPAYAYLLYSRLGDLYVDKQRFQDAATTYLAFVSREPNHEQAPALSMQAIEAYRKGGFAQLVLDGKGEYVERYNFGSAFWQGRDRAQYPAVVAELRTNLKDVAEYHHSVAQKSKRPEDYQQAARWYRTSLTSFPDDAESAQTNYLLADALFESRQYAAAAAEYERTAYSYPRGTKSAAAAYAALAAYQKEEEQLPVAAKSAWHAKATDAGVKFATTFPEHPDATGVLTRAAQDLYAGKDLTRAVAVSQQLLALQPPPDAAKRRIALTIIGQSAFDTGGFADAEAAWVQARTLLPANDPDRAAVDERLAESVYKQAEAKRTAGDHAGAAEDFLRVARVSPGTRIRPTSQYDAAAAFVNAKNWPRAIEVLEAYRREYPKSQYSAEITRNLAVAFGETGRAGEAAVELERIAGTATEEPAVRREALARSADLYEKAGASARSVAMLERYVTEYPQPLSESLETRQRLADIAAKQGNAERVRHWQREIVRVDATAGAQRTDRTRYLAARAQLALATPARDAYRAVRLVAPLKSSLATKRKSLEAALQGYKDAASYNVAEVTTAASFEMAELYRVLGRDLMASERPKGLSADEREQYDLLLEEQAFPFEEQAIKMHEANAARATQGLYDENVKRSYAALAEVMPARYGKLELAGGYVPALQLAQAPAPAGEGTPPQPPPAAVPPRAQADFDRALAHAVANRLTEAELEFGQVGVAYPQFAGAALNLGLVTRATGNLEKSERVLTLATETSPRSALAWNELGVTLRQLGRFADAKSAYERAIALDDSYAPAHRNLGVLADLYMNEGQLALSEFERYKVLSGEDKPVSGWIAELRQRLGLREPPAAPPQTDPPAPAPTPPEAA